MKFMQGQYTSNFQLKVVTEICQNWKCPVIEFVTKYE